MTELSRSIRSRPVPLPTPFRPLADQITGGRKVMLATDTASRRALRSVGKVAATTGDTIHLDPVATSAARMNHVLAHELTHIANPSPVARFFDDDRRQPGRTACRGDGEGHDPLAARADLVDPRPRPVRRCAAPRWPVPATPFDAPRTRSTRSPGTIDAASLAASITGNTRSSGSASPRSARSTSSDVIRRERLESPSFDGSTGDVSQAGAPQQRFVRPELRRSIRILPHAKEWFAEQLEKHADAIVRLLGDRLVTDLERRGGRMWGGI